MRSTSSVSSHNVVSCVHGLLIRFTEGVNLNTNNQITLHSGPSCTLNSTVQTLSNLMGSDCTSSANADSGCAYSVTNTTSFGAGFNAAGGGVYSFLWDNTGMTFWFFSRSDIPADITSGTPDPSSWGVPVAIFPNTICDIASHFYDQAIVLDTTICGDWAGPAYSTSGCPGSCSDIVANATNFAGAFSIMQLSRYEQHLTAFSADAKWRVNYISIYQ